MDDLDLSGVDPLRWAEVRRRVAVIRNYLAITNPTSVDRAAHAAMLGRSVNQFMALVRAWRKHGSCANLAASGAHRGAQRRPSRLALDPEARRIALAAIDELEPDATLRSIHSMIVERCHALDLSAPSRSTIWNMMSARRGGRGSEELAAVIGTCKVRLPMMKDKATILPDLTLAVGMRDGAVVAASLDDVDWRPSIVRIAHAVESVETMRVDRDLIGDVRLDRVVPIAGVKARSALSLALGTNVGGVRLIFRPSKAMAPQRMLTAKHDNPLSVEEVRMVVVRAIADHNQEREAPPASWIDRPTPSTPDRAV